LVSVELFLLKGGLVILALTFLLVLLFFRFAFSLLCLVSFFSGLLSFAVCFFFLPLFSPAFLDLGSPADPFNFFQLGVILLEFFIEVCVDFSDIFAEFIDTFLKSLAFLCESDSMVVGVENFGNFLEPVEEARDVLLDIIDFELCLLALLEERKPFGLDFVFQFLNFADFALQVSDPFEIAFVGLFPVVHWP
jgi:hypothetical protein